MQGRGALLVWVSPVGFPSQGSTLADSRCPYLHLFRKIASRARRKKSAAIAWDGQGDPKIFVATAGLPVVEQRRLAGALPHCPLQRCALHLERRRGCQQQDSYVLPQEAVMPGTGLVGWLVSP